MRKSSPRRRFARNYRLFVISAILIGLVGLGISVSSRSGEASDDTLLDTAQQNNAAGIIANVFNFPMP
ncbi:MAG: hypothetical protein LC731_07070, partial [Acidobacteria bacterium]|nr:hypothetical protein [Acidobacteriota bacterium]